MSHIIKALMVVCMLVFLFASDLALWPLGQVQAEDPAALPPKIQTLTDLPELWHSGIARVISTQSFSQQAKLIALGGAAGDQTGISVAIDGNTAVVGAWQWGALAATGPGKVYIFEKSGASWSNMTQTAILNASDGIVGDRFGVSVAIDGDTIVVGADWHNSARGAAYVFEKGAGWSNMTETAILTATNGADGDRFGTSVAINGNTIVVGAEEYGDPTNVGAVYVFEKGGNNTWDSGDTDQSARLTSGATTSENLGSSVSISLDDTIVAGAIKARTGLVDQGAAYVFEKGGNNSWDTGSTDLSAKLTASDGGANDELGVSVAISGDTVVAGAQYHNAGGVSSAGAVYLFEKGAGWTNSTQSAKLTASDKASSDQLGISVAVEGNVVAAGAFRDNSLTGAVYAFSKPAGGWVDTTQTQKLVASDSVANDFLGAAVAISHGKIAAGAPGDDSLTGAAYIFDGGEADLVVNKTNDAENNLQTDTPFTWTLSISNTGIANADFSNGQVILTDALPLNATYGLVTAQNVNDVVPANNLNCNISGNDLTCRASGGRVSLLNLYGRFQVTIITTPTVTNTLQNPRSGGLCQVDPSGLITEDSENNNYCLDTIGSLQHVYLPLVMKNHS